jgi:hypothetical protein
MDWTALSEVLEKRVDDNYNQFMDGMKGLDNQEFILKAGIITDTQKVYEEIINVDFDTDDMNFLIRFANPLEVLRKEFYRDDLEPNSKIFVFYQTDPNELHEYLEVLDLKYELVEGFRLPDGDEDEIKEHFIETIQDEIKQYINTMKISSTDDLVAAAETVAGMKRIRDLIVHDYLEYGLYLPDMRMLILTPNPLYSLYQTSRDQINDLIFLDEVLDRFNESRLEELFLPRKN